MLRPERFDGRARRRADDAEYLAAAIERRRTVGTAPHPGCNPRRRLAHLGHQPRYAARRGCWSGLEAGPARAEQAPLARGFQLRVPVADDTQRRMLARRYARQLARLRQVAAAQGQRQQIVARPGVPDPSLEAPPCIVDHDQPGRLLPNMGGGDDRTVGTQHDTGHLVDQVVAVVREHLDDAAGRLRCLARQTGERAAQEADGQDCEKLPHTVSLPGCPGLCHNRFSPSPTRSSRPGNAWGSAPATQ
ncbi:hypothetical protein D9M71_505380 [compost metagenome]